MTNHKRTSFLFLLALLSFPVQAFSQTERNHSCPEVNFIGEMFSSISCRQNGGFKSSAYLQNKNEEWRNSDSEFDYRLITAISSDSQQRLISGSGFSKTENGYVFVRNVIGAVPAREMIEKKETKPGTLMHGDWVIGTEEVSYWGAARGNPVNCSTAMNPRRMISISECYYMTDIDKFIGLLDLLE